MRAASRQRIEVRRLQKRVAHEAERIVAMVVGDDQDDVAGLSVGQLGQRRDGRRLGGSRNCAHKTEKAGRNRLHKMAQWFSRTRIGELAELRPVLLNANYAKTAKAQRRQGNLTLRLCASASLRQDWRCRLALRVCLRYAF